MFARWGSSESVTPPCLHQLFGTSLIFQGMNALSDISLSCSSLPWNNGKEALKKINVNAWGLTEEELYEQQLPGNAPSQHGCTDENNLRQTANTGSEPDNWNHYAHHVPGSKELIKCWLYVTRCQSLPSLFYRKCLLTYRRRNAYESRIHISKLWDRHSDEFTALNCLPSTNRRREKREKETMASRLRKERNWAECKGESTWKEGRVMELSEKRWGKREKMSVMWMIEITEG